MDIEQVIQVLQMWRKKFGNIKVVMSVDPEGNSYSTLNPEWSFSGVREGEDAFIDKMIRERKISKNINEEEKEFNKKAKIIGLILWPYYEGFESAEKAVKTTIKE